MTKIIDPKHPRGASTPDSNAGSFITKSQSAADIPPLTHTHTSLDDLGIDSEEVGHMVDEAIVTLLWQSSEVEELEDDYDWSDGSSASFDPPTVDTFDAVSREYLHTEMVDFIRKNQDLVGAALKADGYDASDGTGRLGQFAHDYVLTRNGHGTGFWDRPSLMNGGLGAQLSDAIREYPDMEVEIGDNGVAGIFGASYYMSQKTV
jgi:hypothetical protein